MNRLSPYIVLPGDVVIPSVDDLLYEIGLCLTSVRERPKRSVINKPINIWIFSVLYIITKISAICIPDNERGILLILGEIGRYIGLKMHINMFLVLIISTSFLTQMIYLVLITGWSIKFVGRIF